MFHATTHGVFNLNGNTATAVPSVRRSGVILKTLFSPLDDAKLGTKNCVRKQFCVFKHKTLLFLTSVKLFDTRQDWQLTHAFPTPLAHTSRLLPIGKRQTNHKLQRGTPKVEGLWADVQSFFCNFAN